MSAGLCLPTSGVLFLQTNRFFIRNKPADPVSSIVTGASLYNGNIAAMAVNLPALPNTKVYGYRYDQLNRIKRMDAIDGLSATDTTITPVRTANYHEEVKYDPNGNILGYLRNGTTENSGPLEMDSLNYEYIANTNQLKRVTDKTAYSNNYKSDIDHQPDATNYTYDAIGNLIQDKAEGITAIDWTVYGKIKSITKSNGTTIAYTYDASGNRISQVNTNGSVVKRTYYVRDASGNVMSIYGMTDTLKQKEINLYGSSRLGIYTVNVDVQNCTIATPEITKFTRGNKLFELSNHLGNVLATVSDKKIQVPASGNTTVDYYTAEVVTATDYYPFGMLMPVRQYYIDTTTYNVGTTSTNVSVEDTTVVQLYKHSFSDTPSTHPYLTVPNVLNGSLSSSSWTNSRGAWTSYAGNTGAGRTIAFDNSTADTATMTMTANIASGKKVTIKSFSFYHRVSATGYRHWKMYINGIEVGDSTLYAPATGGTGANTLQATGTKTVRNAVNGLTGSITVLFKLYDHDPASPNGNAQGTFRMDDFVLNGYVNDNGSSSGGGFQYANKGGYRYGFNGQERSDDIKGEGNSSTATYWEYDTRIGRRWNIDPIIKTAESPYSVLSNSPIRMIDPNGDDWYENNKTHKAKHFDGSKKHKGFTRRGDDNYVFQGSDLETVAFIAKRKRIPLKESDPEFNGWGEVRQVVEHKLDKNIKQLDRTLSTVTDKFDAGHIIIEKLEWKRVYNIIGKGGIEAASVVLDVWDVGTGMHSYATKGADFDLFTSMPFLSGFFSVSDQELQQLENSMTQMALRNGYRDFLNYSQKSSAGRRSGLIGRYVTADVLKSIMQQGYLDLNSPNIFMIGDVNEDGYDYGSPRKKYDYFLVFPKTKSDKVTLFVPLKVN